MSIESTVVGSATARVPWRLGYVSRLRKVDAASVIAAVCTAQWLRFDVVAGWGNSFKSIDYTAVSVALVLTWLAALTIYRSRSARIIGEGAEEYRLVLSATLALFGAIAIVSMLLKLDIARGYLAIAFPLGLVLLLSGRWVVRRSIARGRRKFGRYATPVVAMGQLDAVRELAESMARQPDSGYVVVGVCVPDVPATDAVAIGSVGVVPVYAGAELLRAVQQTGADAVAVTATERLGANGIRDLSWQLEKHDVDLLVSPGMADVASPRLLMRPVGGLPLIHVEKPRYNGAKGFEKRLFDIVFSSAVLVLSLPLTLLVAVLVKATSAGPVFYRSERIGLDGKPFQMIKFRTMVSGADRMLADLSALNESEGGVLFKIRRDPRVTPVGRVLRRYSVDEIPQFLNVLRRDMSVVGPRPPLPSEVASYDAQVRRRLLVRPGITGLWQVSGRSDLPWDVSVRLDISYVENWSLMADLMIVVKTVRAMLRGTGAY
ncbi:polyprenyl glycosylphosphotransferase [Mycolicibacterium anyangense]|uniref:Polyprenyl glycosylphosphotransferase n=1 Tax=Mycolicibacterium anyangense TaxID=1431246 RepID=A0A6N4W719_9MYCO|nr:sugar transferase [Mycolicibacterium anyangense]BBZ75201.1 polyprenyl glycosylphosphotransferase [Mycolicibacterium anyangense]